LPQKSKILQPNGPQIWTEGKGQTAIMASDCNPKIELKGSGWKYLADS